MADPRDDTELDSPPAVRRSANNVANSRQLTSPLVDLERSTSPVASSLDRSDAIEFDDMQRQVAEALRNKLNDVDDDFTFKRIHVPKSGRFHRAPSPSPLFSHHSSSTSQIQQNKSDEDDFNDGDWVVEGTGRRVTYDDFTTIDWIHDFAKERVRQRRLRSQKGIYRQLWAAFDSTQAWIIILGVAIATGWLAAFIDISTEWLGDLKEGYCGTGFYLNRKFCCWGIEENEPCSFWVSWGDLVSGSSTGKFFLSYLFYVIFAIVFATTASVLVVNFAPYAAGSGIPEVKTILGGFVIRKFLGLWTLCVKSVGLVLATASGLSIGKEGPLVHVACCCGNVFPRLFEKYRNNEAKKREILSAASAAGISVAFGAPIGGVLFSLEEVSSYFPSKTMWRSFFCALVASVVLQLMNPFRTGKLVLFQVSYDRNWHGFEMIFFVILGVLGGLFGAFFTHLNLRITEYRKSTWIRHFPIEEVVIVTLASSLFGYLNRFMRVSSSDLLGSLFRECERSSKFGLCNSDDFLSIALLLILAGTLKIFFTAVTFGTKVPAGVLTPSMAIGACFGRALGLLIQAWQRYHHGFWLFASCKPDMPCVTPGTYAMVGAAAALGGVTRMTVSLVVIMFELTGALTYVLPIMIAVMISKWVGDAFGKESIYDGIIRLNGFPYLNSKEEYVHHTLASDVMTRVDDLVLITATGMTIENLDELLHETDYKGFPVVNSLGDLALVGYISRSELRYALEEARTKSNVDASSPCYFTSNFPILESSAFVDLRPWMDLTPITASYKSPMILIVDLFQKMGIRYVLLTMRGQLMGLITKKDVLRHLAILEHPQFDTAGFIVGDGSAANLISFERRLSQASSMMD
ncbi:uncharacterized protein VTP21DRAFT_8482 [Calcarisporiella thermophila]|uniref:uncharacterized protein n=1 Tax=Calcarisporiella thermophila TaxID=911321 RepID=UPI0037425F1F